MLSPGPGPGTVRARGQLTGQEQPLGEPGPAFEGPLDPIDLDQVDPERRDARDRGHGTITAEEVVVSPSGWS